MPAGSTVLSIQEFPDICCALSLTLADLQTTDAIPSMGIFYCERNTVVDSCTINSSDYDIGVASFQADAILKYAPSGTDATTGGTALSLNAAFAGRVPGVPNETHYDLILLDGNDPGQTETIDTDPSVITATVDGVANNLVPAGNWIYLVITSPVATMPKNVRVTLRLRTKQR